MHIAPITNQLPQKHTYNIQNSKIAFKGEIRWDQVRNGNHLNYPKFAEELKTCDDINSPEPILVHLMTFVENEDKYKAIEDLLARKDLDINRISLNYKMPALHRAILYNDKRAVEMLINDPRADINAMDSHGGTPLMEAMRSNLAMVNLVLTHPNVNINAKNNYGDSGRGFASKEMLHSIENYIPGVDKRKGAVKTAPQDADIPANQQSSFMSYSDKMILQNIVAKGQYEAAITFFETKLNNISKQVKPNAESLTKEEREEIEKSVREEVTEKIREEERISAKHEYEEKNKALDNLINNYKSLLEEDVEYAKAGIRTEYGLEQDPLPSVGGIGGQMIYVINVLAKRKDKLIGLSSDFAERITKSLQDNNEKISDEGLKFLERIIDTSEKRCNEEELKDSIESVKGEQGFIDSGKAGLFISILSIGGITLRNVIQKIGKYSIK